MIQVCIVEDEREHFEVLENYIRKCAGSDFKDYNITWMQDGIDLVDEYRGQFDIIFLDIQMKHMNGMEAAEKIRKIDSDVILIFITSTVSYAVQGYAVDALGYVLKPVPFAAFEKIFDKTMERINARRQKFAFRISVNDRQIKIDGDDVTYVESQRNNVIVHTGSGDYVTGGPLKKFEEILSGHGFSKCHNAYIVNLKKVDAVEKEELLLADGTRLPISRSRKKEFMGELTEGII